MMKMFSDSDPFFRNWTELIRPERVEIDRDSFSDSYGKFIIQPLERGFATTLGNCLRRILLSSIQGAAISSIRVEGAMHEFSTIPGVLEDMIEIILNLKEVRLKLNGTESRTIRIEKKEKGHVTAGDIISHDGSIRIMNPEKYICTVTGDSGFFAELEVKRGKGYIPAERNKQPEHSIGTIAIDSIFSPILNVNITTSQARVGQQTDYDKLTLEIQTDGSVHPDDALAYSAKILKEQLTVFINFDEDAIEPMLKHSENGTLQPLNENLYRSVEDLELSVRSANCLRNANIRYIGELVQKSEAEMLKTKNFGRKSLNEIKQLLSEMNLSLGVKVEGWEPPSIDTTIREHEENTEANQ